jgi:hypothetical protein
MAILGQRPSNLPPSTGLVNGGIVGAYGYGGMVGNGLYNVDSVRARYAGGGDIALAGGEFVMPATRVNSSTLPYLEQIRTGRAANDNGSVVAAIAENTRAIQRLSQMTASMLSRISDLEAQGNNEVRGLRSDIRASSAEKTERAKLKAA